MKVSETRGLALILTAMGGFSNGIGKAVAYFIKKTKMIYVSFSLGFLAGVMVYVSFIGLLPNALEAVGEAWGKVKTTFG